MKNKNTKQHGFSLMEVLIVIYIFIIVITIATDITINILHAKSRNQAQLQLNQEARNVLETITREARLAGGGSVSDSSVPAYNLVGDIKTDADGKPYSDAINLVLSPTIAKKYSLDSISNPKTIVADQTVTTGSQTSTAIPMDIILVVDVSGSMEGITNGETKIEAERKALKTFINKFKDSQANIGFYKMGLLTFSTDIVNDSRAVPSVNLASLANAAGGGGSHALVGVPTNHSGDQATNMGIGIKTALDVLRNNKSNDPNRKQSIIIMSDGCANTPQGSNKEWLAPIDTDITQALFDKVKIYTIGFNTTNGTVIDNAPGNPYDRLTGNQCFDQPTLETTIATGSQGIYYPAHDEESLEKAHDDLAKEFIGTDYIPKNSTTNLTSSAITADDLKFSIDNSTGQPYLNIELTVKPANYANLPPWLQVSVTVKTGVSSRKYQ